MTSLVSSIWNAPAPGFFWKELEALLNSHGTGSLFFRADDIGRDDDRFQRMIVLFRQSGVPLALAVVPVWLQENAALLTKYGLCDEPLFTWQMHGATHVNYAASGKKSEWCADRSLEDKRHDLTWGREVLHRLLKDAPTVFAPPWNRCDIETLSLLPDVGFTGISRDKNPMPPTQSALKAFDICVDLHTRKETEAALGWEYLLAEFREGIERGSCGIMLHHERMNTAALNFLEKLLARIRGSKSLF